MYKKFIGTFRLPDVTYSIFISILIVSSVLSFNLQYNRLDIQKQISDDIYANTEDQALIIGNVRTSKYLIEPPRTRRFINEGVGNLSSYIDNKTYIVYIHQEGRPDWEIESDNKMEKVIRTYQTTPVYSKNYKVNLSYISSRALTLDIYKVRESLRESDYGRI